jgi:endonuclease YncB( thermonuclease family)
MKKDVCVKRIIDGDTFETDTGEYIRLANVNAPEKGKKGAADATKALKKMIERKTITIEKKAIDDYGRTVADVRHGKKSINKAIRQEIRRPAKKTATKKTTKSNVSRENLKDDTYHQNEEKTNSSGFNIWPVVVIGGGLLLLKKILR